MFNIILFFVFLKKWPVEEAIYFVANNVALNQFKVGAAVLKLQKKKWESVYFYFKGYHVTFMYFWVFSLDVMLVTCLWLSNILRTEFLLFF